LTDLKCKGAKPKDKAYKLFDGMGLYLEIIPSGKKFWRIKYRYLGKEKRISLGEYPLVTLQAARDKCLECKKLLQDNKDPSLERKKSIQAMQTEASNSFQSIADEWIDKNKVRWSEGYLKKVRRSLEIHVFPFIGKDPINNIKAIDLMRKCFSRMEEKGISDLLDRTRQICNQIFRYGIQTNRCTENPADQLRGALATRPHSHYRSIDINDLSEFLRNLERNEARLYEQTRRAVWFSIYTFCRPGEIRKAQWEHIDLPNARWIIPARFMKKRRDHVVPLSQQSLKIIKMQKSDLYGIKTPYVFPSVVRFSNPMSENTVNQAIKRIGFGNKMVAHGFRALARTQIREKLKYDSDIIEKQLAHKSSGPLGEAYDRTEFIEDRTKMMQEWADFVDGFL